MSTAIKRIETTFPESTYLVLQQAAEDSGMTLKNFAASAILEHALTVLERIRAAKTDRIVLSPEGAKQFVELLEHPEVFQAAYERMKKDLQKIDLSDCMKAKP